MATWPSASKASTTNLDSGTDSPASARADIKQNVDNVNSIIDMFNIDSPSNNQILKYNTSNSRFELASDTDTGITDIVQDTTPQLGGNLDLNSYKITNTSVGTPHISLEAGDGGDVIIEAGALIPKEGILLNTADLLISAGSTYNIKLQGITYPKTDGAANQFLKTNGSGVLSFASIVEATGNELAAVADDPAPSLGGNLNVQSYSIVSSSNGNIAIAPNGTGKIVLDGLNWPTADGTNGQVLSTNGSGQLSWATASGGPLVSTLFASVYSDTSPDWDFIVYNNAGISLSSGNLGVIVGTGSWLFKVTYMNAVTSATTTNFNIRNHTDSSDISQNSFASNSPFKNGFSHNSAFTVSSGTKEIRLTVSNSSNYLIQAFFEIYKIS